MAKCYKFWLIVAPIITAVIFYSMTALALGGDGPEEELVLKPHPCWGWRFCLCEEDLWDVKNPGVEKPLWLGEDRKILYRTCTEIGLPPWVDVYTLGLRMSAGYGLVIFCFAFRQTLKK